MSATTSSPELPAFQLLGEPVDIAQVEKGLQKLFLASEDPDDKSGVGVARASLINLALYNENQQDLEADSEVLSELTSESACRSLLINADPNGDDTDVRAWVQVHCQIDKKGRKTVCTEQISFFLSGDSPGLLRNIVFAHLDSDLPLAFWWKGEFSDAFERGLYSRIDRLLFDSESWSAPRNQFLRLIDAQGDKTAPFVMHDLAFTRMNSIRTAVANAFDHPGLAKKLKAGKGITLRYAEGNRMSALYLAAWIADRLEARPEINQSTPGKLVFSSTRSGSPSSLPILIEELPTDRLGTVEIDFDLDGTEVKVSRCQSRDFIRTRIEQRDGSAEEDWLPAKATNDASLVSDILNRAGRNRTHGRVLPMLLELLVLFR
ncbi:MAG: glucose-6-phosphate dehydrogenase assembly protein OpcA [Verrucomicrobiales bacterium]|nr:glucose-6-phosphate dehydrogenase assembly protein OpcA [Verrucomicrobiales bacterium]